MRKTQREEEALAILGAAIGLLGMVSLLMLCASV
jgi:hypothetical protein